MKFKFGYPYESGVRIDVKLNEFNGHVDVLVDNRVPERLSDNLFRFRDETGKKHEIEIRSRFFLNPIVKVDGYQLNIFRKYSSKEFLFLLLPLLCLFAIRNILTGIVGVLFACVAIALNANAIRRFSDSNTKRMVYCVVSSVVAILLTLFFWIF